MDDFLLSRLLGTQGKPVRTVDPADLKAVWNVYDEAALSNPSPQDIMVR